MNAHVQIRQISQYPDKDPVFPDDRVVLQEGGLGGPYRSATVQNLVGTAMMLGGDFKLMPGASVLWEGGLNATLTWDGGSFFFGSPVAVPSLASCGAITMGGRMLATIDDLNGFINNGSVWSFNGRTGEVVLGEDDVLRAGAAPVRSPCFSGWVTAPSPWDVRLCDNTVVTANWVQRLLGSQLPPLTTQSPVLGDSSNRIATTAFVDDTLIDYAPLYSPAFTGIPTAPTPLPGTSTGQLATTAFVTSSAAAYLPLSGGTMTGTLNMTGGFYKYNGVSLISGTNAFLGGGNATTTGVLDTGIGNLALNSVTTGSNNTAVGYSALAAVTTSQFNTAVGTNSLKAVTSGNNTGVGYNSGQALTTGGSNSAFGYSSLNSETTGANNTALGYFALSGQNGGSFNIGIGTQSGNDLTTGGSNVIVGYNTGRGITTGGGNTIIGASLTGLTAASAGCIIVGSNAVIQYDYNYSTPAVHTFSAPVRLSKGYTVATLPAGKPVGTTAYVTDGTAALAWGVTVTGGGSTPYLVWYNGTAWTVVGK